MIDATSIARSHADHIRRIIDDGQAVRIDAYDNTATIRITPPGADGMRHISVRTDDDGDRIVIGWADGAADIMISIHVADILTSKRDVRGAK